MKTIFMPLKFPSHRARARALNATTAARWVKWLPALILAWPSHFDVCSADPTIRPEELRAIWHGKVTLVEHRVYYEKRGQPPVPATVGTELTTGDALETKEYSRASVSFQTVSLHLRPQTRLEIVAERTQSNLQLKELPATQVAKSTQRGGVLQKLKLAFGTVFGIVRGRGDTSLQIETAHGTMETLHTEFALSTSPRGTRLVMYEGKARVMTDVAMQIVSAGQQAIVTTNKTIVVSPITLTNLVQWRLHAPAVLAPDGPICKALVNKGGVWKESVEYYRDGDLLRAFNLITNRMDWFPQAWVYATNLYVALGGTRGRVHVAYQHGQPMEPTSGYSYKGHIHARNTSSCLRRSGSFGRRNAIRSGC